MRPIYSILLIAGFGGFLTGCSDPVVHLHGKYNLERFDDQAYSVVDAKHEADEGGVFAGDVKKLGQDDEWILAYVRKTLFKTAEDEYGWYALDTKDGHVVGPISEREMKTHPVWSKIKTQDASHVFSGRSPDLIDERTR